MSKVFHPRFSYTHAYVQMFIYVIIRTYNRICRCSSNVIDVKYYGGEKQSGNIPQNFYGFLTFTSLVADDFHEPSPVKRVGFYFVAIAQKLSHTKLFRCSQFLKFTRPSPCNGEGESTISREICVNVFLDCEGTKCQSGQTSRGQSPGQLL